LNSSNSILSITINTLGHFGAAAKPAVPALQQFLGDKEESVRIQTTNALKEIDSETAAKTGMK
jgi:HEAT repeat protein